MSILDGEPTRNARLTAFRLEGHYFLRSVNLGRWQVIVHATDERDRYGELGSQGWSLRVTLVRNPKR